MFATHINMKIAPLFSKANNFQKHLKIFFYVVNDFAIDGSFTSLAQY